MSTHEIPTAICNRRSGDQAQPTAESKALVARAKSIMENSYYDEQGWFDSRKDRERYIRYLEWVNKHWAIECNQLRQQITELESVIDPFMDPMDSD